MHFINNNNNSGITGRAFGNVGRSNKTYTGLRICVAVVFVVSLATMPALMVYIHMSDILNKSQDKWGKRLSSLEISNRNLKQDINKLTKMFDHKKEKYENSLKEAEDKEREKTTELERLKLENQNTETELEQTNNSLVEWRSRAITCQENMTRIINTQKYCYSTKEMRDNQSKNDKDDKNDEVDQNFSLYMDNKEYSETSRNQEWFTLYQESKPNFQIALPNDYSDIGSLLKSSDLKEKVVQSLPISNKDSYADTRCSVVDIGAQYGQFSFMSAALGCNVTAVEFSDEYFPYLQISKSKNPKIANRIFLSSSLEVFQDESTPIKFISIDAPSDEVEVLKIFENNLEEQSIPFVMLRFTPDMVAKDKDAFIKALSFLQDKGYSAETVQGELAVDPAQLFETINAQEEPFYIFFHPKSQENFDWEKDSQYDSYTKGTDEDEDNDNDPATKEDNDENNNGQNTDQTDDNNNNDQVDEKTDNYEDQNNE
eukprot:gb/GECH01012530.1/.p1 GENE.gb/GECH01012530.1/~~gb/GECH01012530.1/.p1  ORF type:complete len:485 (+),score=136.87 gb/GECH01012530.1/:1-1455(+)